MENARSDKTSYYRQEKQGLQWKRGHEIKVVDLKYFEGPPITALYDEKLHM